LAVLALLFILFPTAVTAQDDAVVPPPVGLLVSRR